MQTGLFAKGKEWVSFVPQSKAKYWKSLGYCKAHLTNVYKWYDKCNKECPYDDCEIVEYNIAESKTIPIIEALIERHEKNKNKY